MSSDTPHNTPTRQELLAQIAEVQTQLVRMPHAFHLLAQRGVLMGMTNRWVAALADLERAMRLAPRGHPLKAVIYRMRGMANRVLGHLPEALEDLDRALARVPDAGNRSERAEVLRGLGRLPEALEEFDLSIIERDDDAFAFLGRGRTLLALGRLDAAREDLDRALALAPTDVTTLFERARLLREQGQDEAARPDLLQAEQVLREQIARDSDDADALNWLAWIYSAGLDERHLEALELIERAFERLDEAGQRAPYLATRAWTLLRLGHIVEAQTLLERAVAINPFDPDLRARLEQARQIEH